MSDFGQKQIYTEKNETQKPVTTVHYRGYDINVYNDDYGQCFYFYFDNRCITCGTFNPYYKEYIQYEIDNKLDFIEIIHNQKPHHPSAEIRWMTDETTGTRRKVIKYNGVVKELNCQDGDYTNEAIDIMNKIDEKYDKLYK